MFQDFDKHRVLVTGGAGFIGSHLVEEFVRRNARVTVADDLSTGLRSNLASVTDRVDLRETDLVRDDLRPLLAEKSFTLICHLAGNANVRTSFDEPWMDFEKNVTTTINLLEAMRETAPNAKLIHTSSALVYGAAGSAESREDGPTLPIAPYGISKLASEQYVSVYARLHGLRAVSLRLFPVYGPRLRKQVIYDLMCKLRANPDELQIQGDGAQERDVNHVANVVEAYLIVAEKARFDGEVYNVAAEETVTIRRLAEMICERMDLTPRFVFGQARAGDMQSVKADVTRLKSLGYEPRLGFAEGLTDTVNWFRTE
jgi:UDP-glucose 4-epimerase